MIHFLAYIRESMAASRRASPIPIDFEHALRHQCVSLDSLRPHIKSLRSASHPPLSLRDPAPEESLPRTDFPFLGPQLTADRSKTSYIPKHFPDLPSRHTYQQTPVFTRREADPRKVREQATEEGRLGEEALRRLARAGKSGHPNGPPRREKRLWARENECMDSMFNKALQALSSQPRSSNSTQKSGTELGSGPLADMGFPGASQNMPGVSSQADLGPIVNCDRVYWRKSASPDVRRAEKDHNNVTVTVEH